jgi:hypothetical protein
MTDKHIFKILERPNEVLLIIEVNSLKFMQEVNENTFNLPYLKNKDLSKFLSKVIDKFQDKTLKFDYTLNLVDSSNLNFKISLWDGNKHTFNILLKSKEVRDKVKVTTIERYGVEYASQSQDIKDKVKYTNLKNLGVEYPTQSQEVRDKVKNTNAYDYSIKVDKSGFEQRNKS